MTVWDADTAREVASILAVHHLFSVVADPTGSRLAWVDSASIVSPTDLHDLEEGAASKASPPSGRSNPCLQWTTEMA